MKNLNFLPKFEEDFISNLNNDVMFINIIDDTIEYLYKTYGKLFLANSSYFSFSI